MRKSGYFKSSANKLSYCLSIPQQRKRTGVLFMHASNGNKLGPHRMFVEFESKFNHLGYPTFRFDLSGCGDSTGSIRNDITENNDISTDTRDLVNAINFFTMKHQIDSLILFSISRGSRICYAAMAEHKLPLKGMILLSTPVSTNKAAIRTVTVRAKEYLCKLKSPVTIKKILKGQVNIRQICQTFITAIQLRKRYREVSTNRYKSKCPTLCIYGEKDPIASESIDYYQRKCNEYNIPFECHIIKGANHSFFHYKWKEEIYLKSKQWLQKNIEDDNMH